MIFPVIRCQQLARERACSSIPSSTPLQQQGRTGTPSCQLFGRSRTWQGTTRKTALPWGFLAEHRGAARAGFLPDTRWARRGGATREARHWPHWQHAVQQHQRQASSTRVTETGQLAAQQVSSRDEVTSPRGLLGTSTFMRRTGSSLGLNGAPGPWVARGFRWGCPGPLGSVSLSRALPLSSFLTTGMRSLLFHSCSEGSAYSYLRLKTVFFSEVQHRDEKKKISQHMNGILNTS